MINPHFSTKERILSAAEDLFAKSGFAGASLRQVEVPAAGAMKRARTFLRNSGHRCGLEDRAKLPGPPFEVV